MANLESADTHKKATASNEADHGHAPLNHAVHQITQAQVEAGKNVKESAQPAAQASTDAKQDNAAKASAAKTEAADAPAKHDKHAKGKVLSPEAEKAAAEAKKAEELKKAELERREAELKRITEETQDKLDLARTILRNKADGEEILLKRAIEKRGKILGEDDPITMQTVIELEHLYKAHANCQKVEPLLEREMAFFKKFDDPYRQKEAYQSLVNFYRQDGAESYQKALNTKDLDEKDNDLYRSAAVLRRVIELDRPQGKISSTDVRNLALVFEAQNKMELAGKAYDISFFIDGPNAPNRAYMNYGQFLFKVGKYDQAEQTLKYALSKDDDYVYIHKVKAGVGTSFTDGERDLMKAQLEQCKTSSDQKALKQFLEKPKQ